MSLESTWMGLKLDSPLVAGASPLSEHLDVGRRLEDAGISALVMHSLFMEQIQRDQRDLMELEGHEQSYAEALSYFPDPGEYRLGPEEYLEKVASLSRLLDIPVVGSLNGTLKGPWSRYGRLIQQAGAQALELNIYHLPLLGQISGSEVEQRVLGVVQQVVDGVDIPVSVKMTYFHSSPVYLARRIADTGAQGLTLFNRIFHPDIDLEALEIVPRLHLETPANLSIRLLWAAARWGRVDASLAITGGVRSGEDVLRSVMAGADVCQMTSILLEKGPDVVTAIRKRVVDWMEEHDYESIDVMRGSMSLLRCPDPEAFERGNYMKTLQTWRP